MEQQIFEQRAALEAGPVVDGPLTGEGVEFAQAVKA
jgi:hypothetical protein